MPARKPSATVDYVTDHALTGTTPLTQALGLAPIPQPWLPLSHESAQDYYDFQLWLNMAPRPKVVSLIAERNQWEDRALAYDSYRLGHPQAPDLSVEDRQRRDSEIVRTLLHTLQGQAIKLMAQLDRSSAPAMTLDQLTKCVESLVKLDRLVHDQSTENVGVSARVDYSALSDEELQLADQLAAKARGLLNP